MLCYRDTTFCTAAEGCLTRNCPRRFTEEDRKRAEAWWGNSNFPVSYADFSPTCPDYLPPDVAVARARHLLPHLRLHAVGLRHSRVPGPGLLSEATRLTGVQFKRGSYTAAVIALTDFIKEHA